jgi:hypothetical protein
MRKITALLTAGAAALAMILGTGAVLAPVASAATYSISMNAACKYEYSNVANVTADLGSLNDPHSWFCIGDPAGRLGPVNLNRWCAHKDEGHAILLVTDPAAYGWRCSDTNPIVVYLHGGPPWSMPAHHPGTIIFARWRGNGNVVKITDLQDWQLDNNVYGQQVLQADGTYYWRDGRGGQHHSYGNLILRRVRSHDGHRYWTEVELQSKGIHTWANWRTWSLGSTGPDGCLYQC